MASYMLVSISKEEKKKKRKEKKKKKRTVYLQKMKNWNLCTTFNPNFSWFEILFMVYLCHVHISVSIKSS